MKKLAFLISFVSTGYFLSCNTATKDQVISGEETKTKTLVGSWKPVNVTGDDMSERDREDILNSGNMEFTSSGKFSIQGSRETEVKAGDYRYDENTHALELQSGEDKKQYRIEWLAHDKLTLVIPDENLRITFQKNAKGADKNNEDYSRNDQPAAGIAGIWKPVHVEGKELSEEEKQDILNGSSVEFTKSGNYIAVSPKRTEYGRYTETATLLKLETDDRSKSYNLEWLGKNRFAISDEEGRVILERKN